jgi:hypothetical protein
MKQIVGAIVFVVLGIFSFICSAYVIEKYYEYLCGVPRAYGINSCHALFGSEHFLEITFIFILVFFPMFLGGLYGFVKLIYSRM